MSSKSPTKIGPPSLTSTDLKITQVLQTSFETGKLSDKNPISIFYDLTHFRQTCKSLTDSFPQNSLHCFAVKACPLISILRQAASSSNIGLGAECASIGEIYVALQAGIANDRIVFDSPVKSDYHLRFALEKGVFVNADHIDEVYRIDRIRKEVGSKSVIGLRVNPQAGTATIAETFVASATSKFGVPLKECKSEILELYKKYEWLTCVHLHIGSQGVELLTLSQGLAEGVKLAREINEVVGKKQVTVIDIGGGLSVDYHSDALDPTFEAYAALLHEVLNPLFDFRIVTEFGRKLAAKAGWVAAKVQHVKKAGGRTIALTHAGADIFVRPVYQRDKWFHRIEVYNAHGEQKTMEKHGAVNMDIGGPLCFSGDLLAVDRKLPTIETGDWIVIRDAGAYTLAMYNRHTSQLVPAVYGYEEASPHSLVTLKKTETPEELLQFWGANV